MKLDKQVRAELTNRYHKEISALEAEVELALDRGGIEAAFPKYRELAQLKLELEVGEWLASQRFGW